MTPVPAELLLAGRADAVPLSDDLLQTRRSLPASRVGYGARRPVQGRSRAREGLAT